MNSSTPRASGPSAEFQNQLTNTLFTANGMVPHSKVTSSGVSSVSKKVPIYSVKRQVQMSATPLYARDPTYPPLSQDDLLDFNFPLPSLSNEEISKAHMQKWHDPATGKRHTFDFTPAPRAPTVGIDMDNMMDWNFIQKSGTVIPNHIRVSETKPAQDANAREKQLAAFRKGMGFQEPSKNIVGPARNITGWGNWGKPVPLRSPNESKKFNVAFESDQTYSTNEQFAQPEYQIEMHEPFVERSLEF